MSVERIDNPFQGSGTYGHEFRYHLAKGFVRHRLDVVLDAACGSGYGYMIMRPHEYIGVDRVYPTFCPASCAIKADLQTWEPERPFDVAIGFETLEHLGYFDHYVEVLKSAFCWILVSVPIVPTVGTNEFHVHDFKQGDLQLLFEDKDWETYQVLYQPAENSEIAVFKRRNHA